MSEERGTRVYVGNLTDKIKKEHLEEEFTKYGKLNSVWVAFNPPGFAFIEFAKKEEAESACDSLNGQEILGSKLRVEISKGRARQNRGRGSKFGSGDRRGGGGFRGGSGTKKYPKISI
jgi:arginine/serine-rich splicing factor 7